MILLGLKVVDALHVSRITQATLIYVCLFVSKWMIFEMSFARLACCFVGAVASSK